MIRILFALTAALVLGPFLGKNVSWVAQLSEVSRIVIQFIKAIAVPLLFFAIVNAMTQAQLTLKQGGRLVRVAFMNALIALSIGLGLSFWFRPGDSLKDSWKTFGMDSGETIPKLPEFNLFKTLGSWLPQSVAQPFFENSVIPAVILALLIGTAIRFEEQPWNELRNLLELAQRVCERILFWITRLIPIAVFSAVCSSIAVHGYESLLALFPYLGVALLGLSLHVLVTYQGWILFLKRVGLRKFWSEAREPVFQALGTNSSLATLPFTLRALEKLGVSKRAAALGACVGTNLNNDGIILYEGMALLFVAQAAGLDLTLGQQITGAALCLLTSFGIAGVPEAGFISLALVLSSIGLPTENLTLLLSVDWVIGRARSVTNVMSDMVVSMAVDDPK